ncbi:MAG TPA: tetratricopeptide repeat protein [Tepidisphaeraceae bacterium]|nr:tetratricopeptide repeat protein [Tepidisphaeraceae bacterium]
MAKRVNTGFLIGLTTVFGILILAAVAVTVWSKSRKDPRAYERRGDELLAEGRTKEAVDAYKYALHKSPANKELLVKIGDGFNMMVAEDVQNLFAARGAWQQALATDPNFETALRRLVDSHWEQAELAPFDSDNYRRLREFAKRLSDVRPDNLKAKARMYIADVRPWVEGLPGWKPDENAVKELLALIPRDRSDADMPYVVAQHLLKRAREFREQDNNADADRVFAQAGQLIDAAVVDQEKNAALQLRAYQIYSRMDQLERAAKTAKARREARGVIVANEGEAETQWGAKAGKAIAAAVAAAEAMPADDPVYFDVQTQAGMWAVQEKRLADADKIFKDLLAKRPDDQRARLVYARLLNTTLGRRDEALALLSREVKTGRLTGPRGALATDLRAQTYMELIDARLEILRGRPAGAAQGQAQSANQQQPATVVPQGEQRQALLNQVKDDMKRLEALTSRDSIGVLRLRARLQQVEGDYVAAIQTYQRAAGIMEGMPAHQKDYDVLNELALAYLQAGQTGSAKKLLEEVVVRYERYVPAHLQLASIHLNEKKPQEARIALRQAEEQLARMPGDTPEYPRLRQEYDRLGLLLLQTVGDKRLDEQFAKLPEATKQEKVAKANLALSLRKYDEAARLGGAAVKEDPKDLAALQIQINALLGADRRADAVAALDGAIQAHPDLAERLKPARERIQATIDLAKATPEEIYQRRRELILEEPESVARALKLVDLDRDFGKAQQAGEQLEKLHEQNPSDVNILTRLFDLRLSEGRFNAAQPYLDKLVAAKADGANGLLYQFRMSMAKKDTARALDIADALVKQRPEFDVSFVCRGQALQAVGRHAEAVQDFVSARQRRPRNPDALRGMVDSFYAQNRPNDARELVEEARRLFPDDTLFREMELRHELDYGDPLAALAERERLVKERPDRMDAWFNLATAYRQAARSKTVTDAKKKVELTAKGRDTAQTATTKWPDEPRFVSLLADMMLEARDFAGGEKLLKDFAAAPARQGRYEPAAMLADYYARAGRLTESEKAYRDAIEKAAAAVAAETGAPTGAPATGAAAGAASNTVLTDLRVQLSTVLTRMGRFDDALAVLDEVGVGKGAAGAAADRRVFTQRLDILIAAGRRDLAEQTLKDALVSLPNDLDLQMTLVRVNYDGGKFDEALERVNGVLKSEPANLVALYYRGQIRLRKPQPEIQPAIADLLEVRKKDDRNVATGCGSQRRTGFPATPRAPCASWTRGCASSPPARTCASSSWTCCRSPGRRTSTACCGWPARRGSTRRPRTTRSGRGASRRSTPSARTGPRPSRPSRTPSPSRPTTCRSAASTSRCCCRRRTTRACSPSPTSRSPRRRPPGGPT